MILGLILVELVGRGRRDICDVYGRKAEWKSWKIIIALQCITLFHKFDEGPEAMRM